MDVPFNTYYILMRLFRHKFRAQELKHSMKVAWCPLIFTEGWPIRAQSIGCPIHRKSVHGSIKKQNWHWFFREGGQNETSTNEIVSIMTNYIQENSFELGFDGMEIKFTSLQEKKSLMLHQFNTDLLFLY